MLANLVRRTGAWSHKRPETATAFEQLRRGSPSRRSRSPSAASARTRAGRPPGPPRGSRGSPRGRRGRSLGRLCGVSARSVVDLGSSARRLDRPRARHSSASGSLVLDRRLERLVELVGEALLVEEVVLVVLVLVRHRGLERRSGSAGARRGSAISSATSSSSDGRRRLASRRTPSRRRTSRSAGRRSCGALRCWAADRRAGRLVFGGGLRLLGAAHLVVRLVLGLLGLGARRLLQSAIRRLLASAGGSRRHRRRRRRGIGAAAPRRPRRRVGLGHEFGRRLGGRIGRSVGARALRRPEGVVLELLQLGVVGAVLALELEVLSDCLVENAHIRPRKPKAYAVILAVTSGLGGSSQAHARGYSSAGRAPGSHPGGRRFESA